MDVHGARLSIVVVEVDKWKLDVGWLLSSPITLLQLSRRMHVRMPTLLFCANKYRFVFRLHYLILNWLAYLMSHSTKIVVTGRCFARWVMLIYRKVLRCVSFFLSVKGPLNQWLFFVIFEYNDAIWSSAGWTWKEVRTAYADIGLSGTAISRRFKRSEIIYWKNLSVPWNS